MIKYINCIALVICIAGKAGDFQNRLGNEFSICQPTGALNGNFASRAGYGISIYADEYFGNGHGLSWDIVNMVYFKDASIIQDYTGNKLNAKLNAWGSIANYTYHLKKTRIGPYAIAGLGLRKFIASAYDPGSNPPLTQPTNSGDSVNIGSKCYVRDTGIKLSYQLGVGYDFNIHWGATIRYQALRSLGHTLATVETGVRFRH